MVPLKSPGPLVYRSSLKRVVHTGTVTLYACRLQKRLTEENEKKLKLRHERERLLAERERLQHEQFQAKLSDMKDRQFLVQV